MDGRPAYVSERVPTDTLVVGQWSAIVLGLGGPGFELQINPNDPTRFKTGPTQVRVLGSCDVAVRHPAGFSATASIA